MQFPEEAEIVSKLVLEAADRIFSIYGTDFHVMEKSKGDPLTEADIQANEIIAGGIRQILKDKVYSEEDTNFSHSSYQGERVWILDPIDGTREFVAKNPEFAISLGLYEKGKLSFGIVMNPANGEFFWGMEGKGASYQILKHPYIENSIDWENPFHLPKRDPSEITKILVSVSESKAGLYKNLNYGKEYTFESKGSIAYKLALVAVGKYPMTVSLRPKNDWDVAGGLAILRASLGKDLEIRSGKDYEFLTSKLGIGLLAGESKTVQDFWEKFKTSLQSSVRDRW
ncbi:3'(2'),5'-bisphosphate nucleotidase CysQ family protein [Leptospira sarikeiensis]|uniref:3'(2'),5'-bisphosphate nucleotidase CysQ n=1 Tax=Leptospira sarikeiensis TaxID=2484943 RepID=A0A4R9KFE9_9LEPT|nr:3'(2'),5'-bisphosphate nucleotidase CysQ [Leptospira sarikeiensis]TGL65705.1 3'(2'),5'-bisphosphate nucleotidase CysQ [Leptospira sarikeiensis]